MIKSILKLFKKKYNKENRLIRDFEIFDTLLTKEKKLIFIDQSQSTFTGAQIIHVYCISNNKKYKFNTIHRNNTTAKIVSIKYWKTVQDILSRNDKHFIFHFIKWKSWQLIDRPSNWIVKEVKNSSSRSYCFVYKNVFFIDSQIFVIGLVSKQIFIKSFQIYNDLLNSPEFKEKRFDLKIKEKDIKKDLFLFFQKIIYSDSNQLSNFINMNT